MPGRILVLDDEENYAEMLQGLLKQHHFLVDMATKPELALEALEERNYALVISDYKMPIMDGAVFLNKAREIYPDLPVILVSGLMNTPELVKVANMGVTLVLEKPLDTVYFIEQVRRFVNPLSEEEERALDAGTLESEEPPVPARMMTRVYNYPKSLHHVSGENDSSKKCLQDTWEILQRNPFLFVTGPHGSEFELLLREVSDWKEQSGLPNHYFSASQLRKNSVIETLNLLPDDPGHSNVVAVGDVSTISLDEQAFLLSFLRLPQEEIPGEGRVQFVFWLDNMKALNVDLQVEIRSTLVRIPPLGERPGDIATYAVRFLDEFSRDHGREQAPELSPQAMNLLLQYPWRGNFSQMVKVLKKIVKTHADEALPYDALAAILSHIDPETPLPPEGGNLEEVLISRQQMIILRAAERQQAQPRDVLGKLGFDVSAMPLDMGIDQLDLLYPELLSVSRK